jgi:hypothetical protein
MQGPAPVTLEAAGDGGLWRLAVGLLHAAAAAAVLAWRPGVATAVAAAGLLALGGWTLRAMARAGRPPLSWDGQGWRHGAGPVHPQVALDLGGWMLLRLAPGAGGSATWLPVSAAAAGGAWAALRAALYASAAARAAGAPAGPAGSMAA